MNDLGTDKGNPKTAAVRNRPSEFLPACRGIWGRLFGHKYQPRYSNEERILPHEPSVAALEANRQVALQNARNAIVTSSQVDLPYAAPYEETETHIGDVCVRCGHTVKCGDNR